METSSLLPLQLSTFKTSRFLIRLTNDDGLLQIHIKFPFMERIPDRFRENLPCGIPWPLFPRRRQTNIIVNDNDDDDALFRQSNPINRPI